MMATMGQSGLAARQLEPLFGRGTVSGLSEGQLDCRFSSAPPRRSRRATHKTPRQGLPVLSVFFFHLSLAAETSRTYDGDI